MKIAYVSGQGFASSSPQRFLSRVFKDAALTPITPDELDPVSLDGVDLLFLTGVTGEHSPYPQILPQSQADALRKWSALTGANIWMDCAASYYAMDLIVYDSPTGVKKIRHGLGWLSGAARGPHYLQHNPAPEPESFLRDPDTITVPITYMNKNRTHLTEAAYFFSQQQSFTRYSDTLTVPITYMHDNRTHLIEAAYCFSPLIYLDETMEENNDIEILAHFQGVAGNAVALAVKPNGNGNIIVSGVLPTMQADDMTFGDNVSPHLLELRNTLARYRNGHHQLLDKLFTRVGIRDYAHL